MADDFAAQVDAWCLQAKGLITAVAKESAKRVVEVMQTTRGAGGRMRVDTGFLRASLMASTAAMPLMSRQRPPGEGSFHRDGATYTPEQVTLTIASWNGATPIHFGFTANYAAAREFGARGQAPDGFVRGAVSQWPQIVAEVQDEVKRRRGR
jgi:hypothetical protein